MSAVQYKVFVVVDREFGEKLSELEKGVPVWIVDTPTNKPGCNASGRNVQMETI